MKFSISLDQRYYLQKSGYVPFYEILSDSEVNLLNAGLIQALNEKKAKSQDFFIKGRDLWRSNETVKKIVLSRRLVNLAYELIQKKPIRLAFDQYIPDYSPTLLEPSRESSLKFYFNKDFSLQARSSINPLVGMFLLCLSSSPSELDSEEKVSRGGGYFILPSCTMPLEDLHLTPDQTFLLIGYGDMHSQYLYEDLDPQVHFLKSEGYVFGDKLNDRLHPILLR